MALAQIQRWEIGGVAMGPLVLAFATSSFPARFGWTETDVYEAALVLASLVAVLRAMLDSRKQQLSPAEIAETLARRIRPGAPFGEPPVEARPVAERVTVDVAAIPKSAAESTTRRIADIPPESSDG